MKKSDFLRLRYLCLNIIIFSLPLILLCFAFPYIFRLFLPFFLGVLIYFASKPFYKRLQPIFPKIICAVISLFFVVSLIVIFVWGAFAKLIKELFSLSENLPLIYGAAQNTFLSLFGKISHSSNLAEFSFAKGNNINSLIQPFYDSLQKNLSLFLSQLTSLAIKYASNIPSLLFMLFTALLTSYFLLTDKDTILSFFRCITGDKVYMHMINAKKTVCGAVISYIKAQLTIGFIIFIVLLSGFFILRIDYAFLLALITAIVDAVPVLGTGTILIPWAVIRIFSDNPSLGWGLLVLYGICVVTRRICEPKIIGKHFGIHPLATIFAIYSGMKLMGFFGIILGPIIVLFAKNIFMSKKL